MTDWLSANFN